MNELLAHLFTDCSEGFSFCLFSSYQKNLFTKPKNHFLHYHLHIQHSLHLHQLHVDLNNLPLKMTIIECVFLLFLLIFNTKMKTELQPTNATLPSENCFHFGTENGEERF